MADRSLPSTAVDERSRSVRWLLVALIAFWALEVTLVQHWTAFPEADLPLNRAIKDAARRFVLNACACTAITCLFPLPALWLTFVGSLVLSNVLVVYSNYFGAPLSWPVIAHQWREGLAVSDHGISLIEWTPLVVGIIALLVKFGLSYPLKPLRTQPRTKLHQVGIAGALSFLVLGTILAGVYKPIRRINIGAPEYVYGYSIAWVTEWLAYDNDALLKQANHNAALKSRLLSDIEPTLDLGQNIAIVQVESLDFDVVEAKVGDEWVMPYLRELKAKSMYYAVKPFHNTGSSEADFSLLTTSTPNGRVNPFQVRGFSYENALPRLATQKGYRAYAFHGNTGAFFHRRDAYRQMGFDKLYFTEELSPLSVDGSWDDQLLDFSAKLLSEAQEPTLHFLITITSHGPFNRLSPEQCELFPEPSDAQQRYLNSMRYVDHALKDYVQSLPKGTTVFIYGDHESSVQGYCESRPQPNRVPWFIHQTGNDWSGLQRSQETGHAMSGDLTQLDMVCYVRDQIANSTFAATQAPAASLAETPSTSSSTPR